MGYSTLSWQIDDRVLTLTLNRPAQLNAFTSSQLAALAADDIQVSGLCVVGNEDHRFLVLDQLAGLRLPMATVLLEPTGRNTAPAMTLAALTPAVTIPTVSAIRALR